MSYNKVYLIYNDDPATIKGFQSFFQIYSCFSFILFVDLDFLYIHKLAHGSPMVNFILDKSMISCIMTKICSVGVPARG